jgi:probable rRNA maturation factor
LVILQKKVAGVDRLSLERFVHQARRAAGLRGTVNVLVTGSAEVRSLNHRFRGKDKATDVLSFPATFGSSNCKKPSLAGDIAISAEIAARNAHRFGHHTAAEVRILTLHGILHLAGLNHERDNGLMAQKEAQLRRALKLPSALIERAQAAMTDPTKKRKKRKRHHAGRATA